MQYNIRTYFFNCQSELSRKGYNYTEQSGDQVSKKIVRFFFVYLLRNGSTGPDPDTSEKGVL